MAPVIHSLNACRLGKRTKPGPNNESATGRRMKKKVVLFISNGTSGKVNAILCFRQAQHSPKYSPEWKICGAERTDPVMPG